MRRSAPLRRGKLLERRSRLRRGGALRRTTPLPRSPVSPASPAQRAKVAGRACVVCGRGPVDPAHLVPRSLGGCDQPDCVVPLCRHHHRIYDRGELDLLPHLEPHFRAELAHGVTHLGLLRLLRRVTGLRLGGAHRSASDPPLTKEPAMTGEPLSAPARADATDRALTYARDHLERLGYRLLKDHTDRRSGARLLVASSSERRELAFTELRVERLGVQDDPHGALRRRRLRRAARAWLAAHPAVGARRLRRDRLTVLVGRDGEPIGLEHTPDAF